jgi:hypothetical protein
MTREIVQVTPDHIVTVRCTPSRWAVWARPYEVDYKTEYGIIFFRLPEVERVDVGLDIELSRLFDEWRMRQCLVGD